MSEKSREFITIAAAAESRANIKGSEFISRCARVVTAAEALAFVQSIRNQHQDATHNCWAYRISPNEYRFNDDGEPGGTAGQPILQALLGLDLEQAVIVVTRYYGGVKLGAGGLARAYGGGAAAVLKIAGTTLIKPAISLLIEVPFADQNTLYHYLSTQSEINVIATDYSDTGLQLTIKIYQSERERLSSALIDTLRGRVTISEVAGED